MHVTFYGNDLESLDDDLFEFNTKIKFIDFGLNKLKYIGESLLSNLSDLEKSSFEKNPCTNVKAESSSEVSALVQKIELQCNWPSEKMRVKERLKEEIAELKNKTNQQMSELNSTNSEIIDLKAKNTRQANLLKDHEIKQGRYEDSIRQFNVTVIGMKNKLTFKRKFLAPR